MQQTGSAADESATRANAGAVVPLCGTHEGGRALGPALLVGAGALIIRLAYIAETGAVPFTRHVVGDAAGYLEWAKRIAGGEWLGTESFYQAPLYPYVLGLAFTIVGEGVGVARHIQAVWGSVGVACLYVGTSYVLGRRIALLAAALLAVYPPALFFDGVVQKTSLGGVLLCVLLAAMGPARTGLRPRRAAVIGVAVGLLMLTRENAAVWVVMLSAWSALAAGVKRWGGRWGVVGAYVAGVAVVLGPVGVRNKMVGGEWSVSTFQMGPNFYIGNHAGADGLYEPLIRGHETPEFEQRDATALAERAMGRELSAGEVSAYWMSRTWADIRADEARWLGLMGRKLLMVWNRYEVTDAESQYVYADYSWVLRLLGPVWHFGVLCPLAAIGVVATRHDWRRLGVYYVLIISMAAAVALFFVTARYRYPLVPLLMPFAAAGVVDVWALARGRAYRPLLSRAVIAAFVAVAVNVPVHNEARLNAMAYMNLGVALAEDGDIPAATRYFQRAVEGHPESAEAQNNLAQALAIQGRFAEAVPHYRTALSLNPTLIGVDYNLAVALERLGRRAEALTHYDRAVEVDPSDVDARQAADRLRRSP